MMFIVNILAFVLLVFIISLYLKKSMVQAVPVGISMLIVMLYILALVRKLSLIDYVFIILIIGSVIFFVKSDKEKRKYIVSEIKKQMTEPSFIIFTLIMILISIGVKDKLTTWWDDYNFWSTDVKSIYFLNGFSLKYQNVAPEFGDYPPGTQLLKWWFLHFNKGSFNEGLMFAGYYFFIFGSLCQFLHYFDNKKYKWIKTLLAAFCMILLPSCVEAFYADGCCADICMALMFASFLVSIYKSETIEAMAYLCAMVLCKNTSFLWLIIATVFVLGMELVRKTGEGKLKLVLKRTLLIVFPAAGVLLSWYIYCLLNRRVAKLTSNSIKMVTGGMGIPNYRGELLKSFIEGFLKYPMHRYKTGIINLSPLVFYIGVIIVLIVIRKAGGINKREGLFVILYLAITGAVFYLINLICHLTIFATEDQYLEPFAMVSSIERYSCPFTFGCIAIILTLLLEHESKKQGIILGITALIIFLTTDVSAVLRAYIGYRDNLSTVREEREALINDEIVKLSESNDLTTLASSGRMLYIRDKKDLSWVSHAYINFELSPVSVIYDYIDYDEFENEDEIIDLAKNIATLNHAKWIYINTHVINLN